MLELFTKYAASSEGVITWTFEQVNIIGDGRGVCSSLCAHWIRYHGNEQHLATKLYEKEQPGKVNEFRLRQIFNLQDYHGYTDADEDLSVLGHHKKIMRWLSIFGLRPLLGVIDRNFLWSYKDSSTSEVVSNDCCTQSHLLVNALLKYMSCYVYIGVNNFDILRSGNGGHGHALCAWMGSAESDVCFFEPNAGEVWFQHRKQFAKFARDYLADMMLREQYTEWYLYPVARPAFPLGQV